MTGPAFLAVLRVALGFSAGFALRSIWTAVANRRRAVKQRQTMWISDNPVMTLGELHEIQRRIRAAREKLATPTITETDNDHRPR